MKLYYSTLPSIISTVLIIGFGAFFCIVNARRGNISHWGTIVLCMFLLGLLMSIMSGMKDYINTASAVIPTNSWMMKVLSILGALAFAVGIAAIILRKQTIWQVEFYVLSAIILVKTVIVEVSRILAYIRG